MGVTISGMTGAGSIRHNNRSFSAANVDRSRTEQNIVFCNEDLKQVYHMVFDEALAAYNAKKTKTRDKIPDYYEHIRQSKQEKLFHEAIFQIGNMSDCGCGTPDGERAAAALKDFAESFAERNPHLRVFNMVLHMDEATPHLHVDFIPVATEQSRGLSTRVSMKQALKQQGFVGVGRKQTEWAAWMEREKEALTEIAQRHDFEIISLGTNRPHMDLPQFKEAAARLEAVQQQTAAVEREVAELERQRDALKGTVRLLKEADRVNAPLHDIQPEKTLTGAVKGVTVDQVEQLKKMALRSVTDRHKVQELTEENTRLRSQVPSMKKRLEEAQRQQRLEQENRRLRDENYYLQSELQEERSFTERLTDGIGRMLEYVELPARDTWGLLVRKDHPLAKKGFVTVGDLEKTPLLVSRQTMMMREFSGSLGRDLASLNVVATYNLIYNASLMVEDGLGYAICFDRLINTTGDSRLCVRPLVPRMKNAGNLIWKKYQVFSPAVRLFIEEIRRLTEA
jgi:Chromosome segregation ATPases